jgi:hypothetical protein
MMLRVPLGAWKAGLLAFAALVSGTTHAQQAPAPDSCAPKLYRWEEDCSALAARTSRSFSDDLRYIPVTASGSSWLTLGGEYRLRVEGLRDPSFGVQRNAPYTATGERFLAHADLRTHDGPRLFVQLSAATDNGRKLVELPIYRSALDLAQGFVDLPFALGGTHFSVRLGRQELDSDGNRLVSNREATNLRRAFDLALGSAAIGSWSLQAFHGHPVRNLGGAFDDDATPGETFWGGRARYARTDAPATGEAFFFVRARPKAIYQGIAGAELRRTMGLRSTGQLHGFDYAVQAAVQGGSVGALVIRAYGAAADLGFTLPYSWRPRLGVSSGFASGGKAGPDQHARTFDALYSNLGYFTDAPLIYPGNDWDLQPNIAVEPLARVTVRVGMDVLHRVSRDDAVYEQPGFPLIPGRGSGNEAIANLSYVKTDWRVNRFWDLYATYVYGGARGVVTSAGGRDTRYFLLQSDLKL